NAAINSIRNSGRRRLCLRFVTALRLFFCYLLWFPGSERWRILSRGRCNWHILPPLDHPEPWRRGCNSLNGVKHRLVCCPQAVENSRVSAFVYVYSLNVLQTRLAKQVLI